MHSVYWVDLLASSRPKSPLAPTTHLTQKHCENPWFSTPQPTPLMLVKHLWGA